MRTVMHRLEQFGVILRALLLIVLLAIFGGCDDDVHYLVVVPTDESLSYLGEQTQLTAYILTLPSGMADYDADFTWESEDDAVATVDSQGLVTAVGNGTAPITVLANGIAGGTSVVIEQIPESISIYPSPPDPDLEEKGHVTQLSVTAFDVGGAPITNAEFLWSSSDATIVTVSETGYATVVGNYGEAVISVSLGGLSDSVFFSIQGPAECRRNVTDSWDIESSRQMVKLSKGVNKSSSATPNNIQWPFADDPLSKCWTTTEPDKIFTDDDFRCTEDIGEGLGEEDSLLAIFKDNFSDDITISFRGSESEGDWTNNSQTTRVDWLHEDYQPGSARPSSITTRRDSVHRGFFCAYESVRSQLKSRLLERINDSVVNRSTARIYFTGHSLGGALAVLAALDSADWLVDSLGYKRENLVVYTFAAPRAVTLDLFNYYKEHLPNSWQVVARWDLVPHFLEQTYTHTQNIVVLNSHVVSGTGIVPTEEQYTSARIDIGDGRKYDTCTWLGDIKTSGAFDHSIDLYITRLSKILDPGIPDFSLSVTGGYMRMNWKGDMKGPCDKVELYKGNPSSGGEKESGAGTSEWALQDPDGTNQTLVVKGPNHYMVYKNGFGEIISFRKYEPHTPVFTLGRSTPLGFNLPGLYLKVKWEVDDEGISDRIGIYDHKPTDGAWDDYRFSRSAWSDTNNDWDSPLFYSTEDHWVAYIVKEAGPFGAGKVIRQVKHNPPD